MNDRIASRHAYSALLRRGELTPLGKEEHRRLGTRLVQRLPELFLHPRTISVATSGKKRAIDSANEFVEGITMSVRHMHILHDNVRDHLLYFHKSCPHYLAFKVTNAHVRTKLQDIENLPQTRCFAQQVLRRIYKDDFVTLLLNDKYVNEDDENLDPIVRREAYQNEVDLVRCLYSMLSVSPAQGQPYLTGLLAKYFSREESNWFAYVNDAEVCHCCDACAVEQLGKIHSCSVHRNSTSRAHRSKERQ